jgi:hypothetical protein
MSGSLLELLHPCIQERKNRERGTHNAVNHLRTPHKAFNTSLLDIKLLACGDALKRRVGIAGVHFIGYLPTLYQLLRFGLRDESKITQAHLIHVSETQLSTAWLIWKRYINHKRQKWRSVKVWYAVPPWCKVFLQNWQSLIRSKNFMFLWNSKVRYYVHNIPPPHWILF